MTVPFSLIIPQKSLKRIQASSTLHSVGILQQKKKVSSLALGRGYGNQNIFHSLILFCCKVLYHMLADFQNFFARDFKPQDVYPVYLKIILFLDLQLANQLAPFLFEHTKAFHIVFFCTFEVARKVLLILSSKIVKLYCTTNFLKCAFLKQYFEVVL